ncbi:hypothetical protein HYALB_00001388 [Hymenoscyphus albidus]|uniref:Scaffold protein Nfu/NifU N-terminal domain-containing protein n=1 Tax=Hymenoscyphus albidus TaxID=595503 RepID=A0A9N9L9Q2_9HELO|nr:hypothetical protein HYALB_00001388 [Hymenoscyphus albidus]
MASARIPRAAVPLLAKCRPLKQPASASPAVFAARYVHQSTRLPAMSASNSAIRPKLQPLHQPSSMLRPTSIGGTRSIFIQTETTPNPDALKFLPNHSILPEGLPTFLEYKTPGATIKPPYPSPLAASLMNINGIIGVFYGANFITVTKDEETPWPHIKPEVFALITETINSGKPIVNVSERSAGDDARIEEDSLAYNENDSETVGMIKELLETRVRPSIQGDGGDIAYMGFEDGYVKLKLHGSCTTCESSTNTLNKGVEGMLMHYIPEVKGVKQVKDPSDEISAAEFEKFEQKLLKNKESDRIKNLTSLHA